MNKKDQKKQAMKMMRKTVFSLLLGFVLTLEFMPGLGLTTYADGAVNYRDASGTEQTCTNYTVVTDSTNVFEDGKWYVVNSNPYVTSRITVDGTAHLILCNGATLTADFGIHVASGTGLAIYGQVGDSGSLIATGLQKGYAGIGSNGDSDLGGSITINGGTVYATGKHTKDTDAHGIEATTVIINGGSLTAIGNGPSGKEGYYGYGITGHTGGVTINGGTVIANGGLIGIIATNGNLTINGGTVTATAVGHTESPADGYGIYASNKVEILGGDVTASSKVYSIYGNKGITIGNGLTVKAGDTTPGTSVDSSAFVNNYASYKWAHINSSASHSVTLTGGTNATADPADGISQTELTSAMETVTYTANAGYHFEEFTDITDNGITVVRINDTTVTVSGTPTADANITVPDAVAKTYTVTLDNQGATAEGAASVTATYNAVLPGISGNLPAKTGYIFCGYYSQINGDGTQYLDANGTPTENKWTTDDAGTLYACWMAIPKEATPSAIFTAIDSDSGTLSDMTERMKYSLDSGTTWTDITGSDNINLTGLSACTIQVVKKGDDTTTIDSDPQSIIVTKAEKPTAPAVVDCTTIDNNDGKITGVSTGMEYKKSDADVWTSGTGEDITGLVPGTYYVRVKPNGTVLASENQELTVKRFISVTVTFRVINGSWDEGECDTATADKTVTLTGHEGDTLKLTASQIPAVGSKPNDTYRAGSWDVTPDTEMAITEDTTFIYTYVQKEAAVAATVTANNRIYDGTETPLVTVTGEPVGGTMQYALDENATTAPITGWDTSIPMATNAGTYYVWFKAAGDNNHLGSEATAVTVIIYTAFGETNFVLPSDTTAIEPYAFAGDTSITSVDARNCTSIGDYAFQDCLNLSKIRIPANCSIGKEAFDGCEQVLIYGRAENTDAESYCTEHDNCFFVEE